MAHAGHALDDACGEEGGDDDGEQWHWQIEHAPWMPATSPTVQRRWDSLPAAARRRAPPRPARGPRRGRRRRSSRRRCSPRRPRHARRPLALLPRRIGSQVEPRTVNSRSVAPGTPIGAASGGAAHRAGAATSSAGDRRRRGTDVGARRPGARARPRRFWSSSICACFAGQRRGHRRPRSRGGVPRLHSPGRKARRRSPGLNRPVRIRGGAVFASALSFISMSAARYP
jgi:hypothetical protein